MSIRERWNAQADEHNQFDSLGADEIERFADEVIAGLEAELHKHNPMVAPPTRRRKRVENVC